MQATDHGQVWPARVSSARCLAAAAFLVMMGGETGMAETDGARADGESAIEQRFNIKSKTLGGRQFWGDVLYFRGWRIQHNVLTGHHRLLDPDDVRHAWGSLEACTIQLNQIKEARSLPGMEGRAVIVIHGIVRSSKSFDALRKALEEDECTVVGFDYPSTRVTIEESAEYLHQVIESLEGIDQIDLVVHSMGGLIVRTYLARHGDPRLHRMVMLGVPNLGANMANIVQTNPLFRLVFGPAGQQLIVDPEGFIAELPAPDFEFAVIAGARGVAGGWNPLLEGDDDGTVEVSNTRLPGAVDFMTVEALHSFLMDNEEVIAATVRFLKTGALRESGVREPIQDSDDVGKATLTDR